MLEEKTGTGGEARCGAVSRVFCSRSVAGLLLVLTLLVVAIHLHSCGTSALVRIAPRGQRVDGSPIQFSRMLAFQEPEAPRVNGAFALFWEGEVIDNPYEILGRLGVYNYGSAPPEKGAVVDSVMRWGEMTEADGIVRLHSYDDGRGYSGLLVRFLSRAGSRDVSRIGFLASIAPTRWSSEKEDWIDEIQVPLQKLAQGRMEESGYYTDILRGRAVSQSRVTSSHSDIPIADNRIGDRVEYLLEMHMVDNSDYDIGLASVFATARLFSLSRQAVAWHSSASASYSTSTTYVPNAGIFLQNVSNSDALLMASIEALSTVLADLPEPEPL